jgi:hypothetical protein
MSRRYARRARLAALDPVTDFHEIYRQLITLEFPWDMSQSLSFALFRTYAVPSIAALLQHTGEFRSSPQRRYDDTSLILEAVLEHGFDSVDGRTAVRRMNQMHGAYSISNDDMRYVLSTFVVTPVRWLRQFGWRPMSPVEIAASVNYMRELGRRMAIKDIPFDYAGFEELLDSYEAEHFAFNGASRAVADATLDLMTTFPPNNLAPSWLVRRFSYALMDHRLREALQYPSPGRFFDALSRGALRARGAFVWCLPPRRRPKWPRDAPNIRSYPDGYDVSKLGTFPG